jgi:hypothetical protein
MFGSAAGVLFDHLNLQRVSLTLQCTLKQWSTLDS